MPDLMRDLALRAPAAMLDVVFPPRCAGCGRRGRWVCNDCFARSPWIGDAECERCGSPAGEPCECAMLQPELDWVRSVFWYEAWIRRAIHMFKYEGERARRTDLARHMQPLMSTLVGVQVIPVPLHADRERERGYNQALLLAKAIDLNGEIAQPLVRCRATAHQVGLSGPDRVSNVRDAFQVRKDSDVSNQRYVLLDDVMTTGSTLGECARVLKQAGAAWVGAVTLARDR